MRIETEDTSHHYHGFGETQLHRLRTARTELAILAEQPSLVEAFESTIAPLKYRGTKNSGVYDSDNQLIPSSARIRGAKRVESELDSTILQRAKRDQRYVYYLGSGEKHYGHFLLEVLCRAWAWQENGQDRVAVLQTTPPPFAKALYALIPGLIERMEIIAKPTRYSSVTVPGASFVIGREARVAFKRMCEGMAERAIASDTRTIERPLYLSRAGLDSSRRTLEGEERLEQFLEKEGFVVVRPESLPITEQIVLFNRHRWIVSTIGSACHTRVFSLRENNLVTITPGFFNQNHVLCDLLCEGSSHYVHALVKPDIGTDVGLDSIEPLLIEPNSLLAALKKLGLVRQSAIFEVGAPDLDEYKRRWIAAARWRLKEKPANAQQLRVAVDDVTGTLGTGKSGILRHLRRFLST